MATSKEKLDLIDDIKRPERRYRITIFGRGLEQVVGTSSYEEYNYWIEEKEQRINEMSKPPHEDVSEPFEVYMFEKEQNGSMPGMTVVTPREYEWYEYDEVYAVSGAYMDSAYIEISEIDNLGETISDVCTLPIPEFQEKYDVDSSIIETPIHPEFAFVATSEEKGTFFEGIIKTKGKIDLQQVIIQATELDDGTDVVDGVCYGNDYDNLEEVENNGGSTNGKGLYVNLVQFG